MNKKNLVNILANRKNLTKKESEEIITVILETIIRSVSMGEKVTLVGFGSFAVRERHSREGVHPKTGEKLYIPASKTPTFSAGKFFRDAVNKN